MPWDLLIVLQDRQLGMNQVSEFWLEAEVYSMIFLDNLSFALENQVTNRFLLNIRVIHQS